MRRIDKGLLFALVVGLVLRLIPLMVWGRRCVRDECTYRTLASSLVRGEGMVGSHGWLWAPGYPSVLAAHTELFGTVIAVRGTQVVVSTLTIWLLWRFTRAHFGPRAGLIAALIQAFNPTHIFFATSLWSECLYTGLLLGTVFTVGWTRGEAPGGEPTAGGPRWWRGLVVGAFLGACVLFRGVATYLLPLVGVALMWGRWRQPEAWRSVFAMTAAAALVVAPYSAYATQKFGGFIISDRTLGQMMWLGNNTYEPITFDFGNGSLSDEAMDAITETGRDHCPYKDDPVKQDACELRAGVAWIAENPGEFIARMPLRVSQMVTPHSLLTRNLRTGRWRGLPQWADEVLVLAVVATSFVVLVGGTIGLFARGRGWFAVTSVLVVGYHVAAIACLAGLSRYRVPLEPLWTVYAAALLAEPRGALAALRSDKFRFWGGIAVTGVLVLLMMRFLPSGWKEWQSW